MLSFCLCYCVRYIWFVFVSWFFNEESEVGNKYIKLILVVKYVM